MTLNLLSPDHGDWNRRRLVIRAGIARWRPDLVALQETVKDAGYDQVPDVLGPAYHVVHHSRRSRDGVGATFASRWPIDTVHEVDLRVTDRVDLPWSAAVVGEIEAPPPIGPLLFVHHKPTWQIGYAHERELQAVACARFVENEVAGRHVHVVLAGDFDDTPDSASIRFWTGKQSLHGTSVAYRDTWAAMHPEDPGHTFTPTNPLERAGEMSLELGRRIDYVMIRCGVHGPTLEVVNCQLAFDEPVNGVWASDHFGVVAELAAPRHPPGAWATSSTSEREPSSEHPPRPGQQVAS
ncbi:endonuclease/exonuclease/phosphatase family protein [Micromonospora sp. NPDC000442]|uniref:endonuclease/exonuclease/phosphatase family protein n=1 Tax=Micromonospora sp. NPDC000442 TaxID=3364217 RepID=UPI0036AA3197